MTVFRYPGNLRIGLRDEAMKSHSPRSRMIQEDRMLLMVLLSGHQSFTFGHEQYVFSTLLPQDLGPKAIFLNLKAGQRLDYLESMGAPLVKISVSFDAKWLAQAGTLIEDPARPGLHQVDVADLPEAMTGKIWSPDAELIAIGEDIRAINTDFQHGLQSRNAMNLSLLSRGIDLLRIALAQTGTLHQSPLSPDHIPHCDPRLERLSAYIYAHLDSSDWGPEDLAKACGVGMRSLQRLCRTELGCSPSEYIRTQRMQAAFTALSRRRVSLQQAAFVAGYSNTSNFATAFKRIFGITPSQVQH